MGRQREGKGRGKGKGTHERTNTTIYFPSSFWGRINQARLNLLSVSLHGVAGGGKRKDGQGKVAGREGERAGKGRESSSGNTTRLRAPSSRPHDSVVRRDVSSGQETTLKTNPRRVLWAVTSASRLRRITSQRGTGFSCHGAAERGVLYELCYLSYRLRKIEWFSRQLMCVLRAGHFIQAVRLPL